MQNNFLERIKGPVIVTILVVAALIIISITGKRMEVYTEKYQGFDLSGSSGSIGRTNTYTRYREHNAGTVPARQDIPLDIFSWSHAEGAEIHTGFRGEDRVLYTAEKSFVEYRVQLERDGLYNFYIEYFPLDSRGINIERSLRINGEIPFLGADRIIFQRVWGDTPGDIKTDNQGNQIRPSQVERPRWESAWFKDPLGYIVQPYEFHLRAGDNVIRLEGVNEPMAVRAIVLKAPLPLKSYNDYIASVNTAGYKNTDNSFMIKIQGENALYRSDPSLYAIYDRSSGATEPASVAKIKLNMIGGETWRVPGQWIEWEFEVPENGMYRISVKGRQNYNRGFVSNRSVIIDGVVPCYELGAIPFRYDNKWKYTIFQDANGEELFFPLSKGKHTIRLQATLGELGELLNIMEESVYRLNGVYRKILVLTGTNPDPYRDYRVDFIYPEVIETMALESKILYKLVDDLTAYSGERSPQAAVALILARQLELFSKRPDKIPRTLGNFRGNVGSLGDSLLTLTQSQLDIDYITISAAESKLPKIKENFFVGLSHEIRSFLASFFVDYNSIGDVYRKGEEVVTVWMLTGRDQSTILKGMIDDTYTPKTNLRVNVKLVGGDALMPAVVAGTGPDMVLTVGQGDPVNYALRKAVFDLSKFSGFEEAVKQFDESVLVPFRYGGGMYGLPETQGISLMFYRKDIFEELGITIPETWDDLITILPVIQKNNMDVGIPSANTGDMSNFMAHLFQRGGRLYNDEGSRTMLDSEIAIEAFDVYTKFFTHYRTPPAFDFPNRFRRGEMPLGFTDYTAFNFLEVFAPEIRGLWGFARMPGLKKPDGTIDRSIPTGGGASMIFSKARNPELAWEFLKWWISADTQLRYGRELESVMGAAARYNTANRDAFIRLPWSAEQLAVIEEQRKWTVGTPEVPGGYYVSRHLINATRRILNTGEDTRETLLDYSITINDELIKKRKEFGLE
jgi:ABC-type glycerol-3-phosphate transport system substrate-binding protein